jgi:hypothetical protein
MKSALASLVCLCMGYSLAYGDGYPFDSGTQEVFEDSLRIQLTPDQVASISATGVVTLSSEQLGVIRLLYPAATPKQAVIAATFNDNNEGLEADDVYCFWVRADELAITINHAVLADPFKVKNAPYQAADASLDTVDLRLSPEGQLYHYGKEITLRGVSPHRCG